MISSRKVLPALLGAVLCLALAAPASARPFGPRGHQPPVVVLANLLTKLKLTPAQKAKIFAVLGRHKDEIATLGAAKAQAHADLQDAVTAASPDEAAIRKAAAQLDAVDLKIARLRGRLFPQLMRTLTPRQQLQVAGVMMQASGWLDGGPGAGGEHWKEKLGPGRGHGAWAKGKGGGKHLMRLLEWGGEHLDLTAPQREQIRGIVQARGAQLKSLHRAAAAARRALGAAVRQQTPDERAIRQAAADVARTRLDFALERAQIHARVARVLTPAQRTKLQSLRTEMQGARLERVHAILTLVRELL